MISLDESRASTRAFEWALTHVVKDNDNVHILTVLPPLNYSVYPVAPVATAAAVTAVTHQWEAQKRHNEVQASDILRRAAESAQIHYGIHKDRLELHALPGAGGASGVAESVVEYARAKKVDLVIVGSRGMGSLKRSLMSFVGLGSVSDYVLHHCPAPVMVVRYEEQLDTQDHLTHRTGPRRIVVACDDSHHSEMSLQWALENLLNPQDQLHIISSALPVPFPVMDETGVAAVALESQMWRERQEESQSFAERITEKAALLATQHGVPSQQIVCCALKPGGGASDVGGSICKYAEQQHADVVVLGSRGMGSLKRSLMSFIGLGSVSDYCAHHVHGVVTIVKSATYEEEEYNSPTARQHTPTAASAAAQ